LAPRSISDFTMLRSLPLLPPAPHKIVQVREGNKQGRGAHRTK
jgi:hypothetical protein